MYPTDVPHLHEFCTFSVPHLKLEQLATLILTLIHFWGLFDALNKSTLFSTLSHTAIRRIRFQSSSHWCTETVPKHD